MINTDRVRNVMEDTLSKYLFKNDDQLGNLIFFCFLLLFVMYIQGYVYIETFCYKLCL